MTESTMAGDIIDAHTHVDEVPALGWIDPPEKLVKLLDEVGIARAVVMTYTELPGFNPHALEYLADVVARFPDRLVGFVRLHPWYDEAADLLRRAISQHRMKGIKLHPVGTLDHPRATPRCGSCAWPASEAHRRSSTAGTSR